jgi:hypothetical protein
MLYMSTTDISLFSKVPEPFFITESAGSGWRDQEKLAGSLCGYSGRHDQSAESSRRHFQASPTFATGRRFRHFSGLPARKAFS